MLELAQYLVPTSRGQSVKPAAGKPKPWATLEQSFADVSPTKAKETGDKRRSASANPLQGGIERTNRAITMTLNAPDNPITKSTAYSRTLHVQSCATGHQSGGGPGRKWALHRNAKLSIQAADAESTVLKGVVGYISGYTGKSITNTQLKELVERLGGTMRTMGNSAKITHIFCLSNLSGSKAQAALESKKKNRTKLVLPEWVIECAKRGKRVSETQYACRLFNEIQESTYDHFTAVASERESASPSDASTSSSSISPPIASTSTSYFPASPRPRPSSPKRSSPPRPKAAPTKVGESTPATSLLLAQIAATKAAQPPSPKKRKRAKHTAEYETAADVYPPTQPSPERARKRAKREEQRKREEVVVLGSSDTEFLEGPEDELDELDEWGMPPSGQRR
ncbi:hypothetical protein JCM10213_002890 [Rhodosporidiobolus nylandii]